MKGKQFKAMAVGIEDDAEVLFSCDEELNTIRSGGEIARLMGPNRKTKTYVIYGFDGTEVEE